jgi:hypothetical protein
MLNQLALQKLCLTPLLNSRSCVHAVLVCNEFRSQSVQAEFKAVFSGHFNMRLVGAKHMHEDYNDESIQLFVLSRLRHPAADAVVPSAVACHKGKPGTSAANPTVHRHDC